MAEENGAAQSPAGGEGGGGEQHWTSGWSDPALASHIQGKGYDGPEALAKAYRSAESHFGTDPASLLRMPREDDAEGVRALWERLGMPSDPKDYELPEPGDGQMDMRDWFRQVAPKVRLTKTQAKELAAEFGEFMSEQNQNLRQTKAGEGELVDKALRQKWGNEYQANMEHADRAAERLGWDGEALANLRDGKGDWRERILDLLAFVGRNQREDGFPAPAEAGGARPFGDTPQARQQKFKELSEDPAFMKRLTSGDPAAAREFRAASELAFPEEAGSFAGGPPR